MQHPFNPTVQIAVTCARQPSPCVPARHRAGGDNNSQPGEGSTQPAPRAGSPNKEQLILEHLPLVKRLAAKFLCSGELLEDLVQAGHAGLVKAANGFQAEPGLQFATFAIPAIVGEFKNYFRDHGWAVKVPGEVQIRKRMVDEAVDGLTQTLGRPPNIRDIVDHTGLSQDEVLQTLEVESAAKPPCLDAELR